MRRAIDTQRTGLATLLSDLGPDEWTHPSLCDTGTRRRLPYVTGRPALVDVTVHGLDIAVPLGRAAAPPPEEPRSPRQAAHTLYSVLGC